MSKSWLQAGVLLGALALTSTPGVTKPQAQREKRAPQSELLETTRYEIDVSFQPEKGSLHARTSVTVRMLRPAVASLVPLIQALDAIEFELNPRLKILEVTDAQGRKLESVRSQRLGSPKVAVDLAESLLPGQDVTLTFTYEGVLPPKPLDYIAKDGILLGDESRWYPAVDISAFTRNVVRIRVPHGWEAFTSGESVGPDETKAGTVYEWKTNQPVSSRSLVALPRQAHACVPDLRNEDSSQPAPLRVCYVGAHQDSGKRMAARARDLLERDSKAFATYSSAMLLLIQGFPGQRGAIGYSAPGFLVLGEDAVRFGDYPGYAPEFLPHEIAHQWFPIQVTLARPEDGWLAEGLAEYLAWRYLAEKEPGQARRLVARAMGDALAPEPLRPLSLGLKLFGLEGWDMTQKTLYERGLLVWRTLETVIDRERVDRALKEYYLRYAGRSASIADFRKVCEEIAHRDLAWFFDYFINGTHIPEIELRRTPSSAPNEAPGEIIVRNVPPEFSVRVEMRLETSAGPIEHSVATRGEVTPFTVTSDHPITRITLDPNARILRWTEAARRNRAQQAQLAGIGALERVGQLDRAVVDCEKALALDPENLASNEQPIRFLLGRLRYRQGRLTAAFAEFQRVLELGSLDAIGSDFNRAWSRFYRARIERRRGHLAAARAEAEAGLGMHSPALFTSVQWSDAPGPTTAEAELRRLSR